jgi:Ca-activated chloride channel family protein
MRFRLLLTLFFITNVGCSDAEDSTPVQQRTPSAPTSTAATAPATPSVPTAELPAAELAGWMDAARSGSLILLANHGSSILPGLSLNSEISISVTGTMARAKVVQHFTNPSTSWVEGIYVFPLPDDAAVDEMRILTDGRVIEGQVQEKEEAKKTYDAAKKDGRRAGLVVQERPNIFTTRIANIRPGSEVTIEIEYQQSVRFDDGEFSLRVPTVVGPRYMPGQMASEAAVYPGPSSHRLEIDIDLMPGFDLERVDSPYHPIVVFDDGHTYGVSLAEGPIPADRDFELRWKPAQGLAPTAMVFGETQGENSYALMMVSPPEVQAASQSSFPRDVVFVVDTSGSMAGTSLSQAKQAMTFALHRLDPADRFNVIEFNSVTTSLFSESRTASASNLDQATQFIAGLTSNGGTDIAPAIRRALLNPGDATRELRQVVFLTDGGVGNEAQLLEELKRRVGDSRIFSIGIGTAPNTFFMRKLAQLGRGSFTHIGDGEEVAEKMTTLLRKLESAVLTDIEIEFSGVPDVDAIEMYPYKVPDLYLGEPVLVALKLDVPFRAATISGWAGDSPWRVEITDRDIVERPGIHVMWARQAIEERMDDRLGTSDDFLLTRLRDEVVELALEHHLVSAYTSLVAVDVTPERYAGESLEAQKLGASLPASFQADGVFGLGKGATPAGLQIGIGMLFMLSSWMVRRVTS